VRHLLFRRISYLIASFIDVGNILLNFLLYFLIKSKTCVVAGASPFSHMRDARYRESASHTVYKFSLTSPTRTHDTMLLKPRLTTTSKNLNSLCSAPSSMSCASHVLCMAPVCTSVEDGVEIICLSSLLPFFN
jgi:hypothetical protein